MQRTVIVLGVLAAAAGGIFYWRRRASSSPTSADQSVGEVIGGAVSEVKNAVGQVAGMFGAGDTGDKLDKEGNPIARGAMLAPGVSKR